MAARMDAEGYWYSFSALKEERAMVHLLLAVIYLSFISLGLPDSLLGSAWPVMHAMTLIHITEPTRPSMISNAVLC